MIRCYKENSKWRAIKYTATALLFGALVVLSNCNKGIELSPKGFLAEQKASRIIDHVKESVAGWRLLAENSDTRQKS